MKNPFLRLALRPLLAIITLLAIPAAVSYAEEVAKIDLEEAKAELAKSKAVDQPSAEKEPAAESEDKPPRRRLFSRRNRDKDKDKDKSNEPEEIKEEPTKSAEPEELAESPESESEERKPRRRLFARDRDKEKPATSEEKVKVEVKNQATAAPNENENENEEAEAAISEASEKPEKNSKALKRFSPFAKLRNRDKGESEPESQSTPPEKEPAAAPLEDEQEKVVQSEPAAEAEPEKDGDRKGFLGGLFAKDASSESVDEKSAEEVEEKKEENEKDEKKAEGGGSLFGLFRSSDEKKFAKAEKTKLGKSLESAAAAPSSRPAKQKIKGGGELGWYVVTEEEVPFYAIGPGQPMPPEKLLDRGSMLTVTKGGWGWCNVKLGTGELGVVSTKAMRPATVAEISRRTRGGATASKARGSRSLFNILSRGPAPKLDLPSRKSEAPIRNFGLLPPIDSGN